MGGVYTAVILTRGEEVTAQAVSEQAKPEIRVLELRPDVARELVAGQESIELADAEVGVRIGRTARPRGEPP